MRVPVCSLFSRAEEDGFSGDDSLGQRNRRIEREPSPGLQQILRIPNGPHQLELTVPAKDDRSGARTEGRKPPVDDHGGCLRRGQRLRERCRHRLQHRRAARCPLGKVSGLLRLEPGSLGRLVQPGGLDRQGDAVTDHAQQLHVLRPEPPRLARSDVEDAEKAVTGSAATKAQAAAVKAVDSGTAGAVTTDYTGTGYEVTVTKSDGSTVEIHLDSSFSVMAHPLGPPGAWSGGAPPSGSTN